MRYLGCFSLFRLVSRVSMLSCLKDLINQVEVCKCSRWRQHPCPFVLVRDRVCPHQFGISTLLYEHILVRQWNLSWLSKGNCAVYKRSAWACYLKSSYFKVIFWCKCWSFALYLGNEKHTPRSHRLFTKDFKIFQIFACNCYLLTWENAGTERDTPSPRFGIYQFNISYL